MEKEAYVDFAIPLFQGALEKSPIKLEQLNGTVLAASWILFRPNIAS
jgi:hypothetical protein